MFIPHSWNMFIVQVINYTCEILRGNDFEREKALAFVCGSKKSDCPK